MKPTLVINNICLNLISNKNLNFLNFSSLFLPTTMKLFLSTQLKGFKSNEAFFDKIFAILPISTFWCKILSFA